jgi:hypothetical protein
MVKLDGVFEPLKGCSERMLSGPVLDAAAHPQAVAWPLDAWRIWCPPRAECLMLIDAAAHPQAVAWPLDA